MGGAAVHGLRSTSVDRDSFQALSRVVTVRAGDQDLNLFIDKRSSLDQQVEARNPLGECIKRACWLAELAYASRMKRLATCA
jgi:hypothetical protein